MIATTPQDQETLDAAFATNPTGAEDDTPTIRILLVEDNANDIEILTKLLQKKIADRITLARIEIMSASTLKGGLALAKLANCTVLDLNLGDSSSEETRKAIRKFRPPVICVTGDDDPLIMADCLAEGAEHVFVKTQTHGLCGAILDCIAKDLYRLNGLLTPHGNATG